MLKARLASPIFTCALALPMVRTTSAIGPFCRAKTCSTAERIADLRAFARRVRSAIARPFGFLRWIRDTRPRSVNSSSFFAER